MKMIKIILGSPLALIRLILIFTFTLCMYIISWTYYTFARTVKERVLWDLMGFWSRNMLRIMGIKIVTNKKEPIMKQGLILPNHRSYIDIFISLALAPTRIIAKKEIASWPILGRGFKIFDTLLLDRGSLASRIKNLKRVEKVLNSGKSLIIYPEGTTHKGPEVGKLKPATFSIVAKNNIPIQLMAIEYRNPDDAWVGDDLFVPHFIRRSGIPVRKVGVSISSPMSGTDEKELTQRAHRWLSEETVKIREYFDKKQTVK